MKRSLRRLIELRKKRAHLLTIVRYIGWPQQRAAAAAAVAAARVVYVLVTAEKTERERDKGEGENTRAENRRLTDIYRSSPFLGC